MTVVHPVVSLAAIVLPSVQPYHARMIRFSMFLARLALASLLPALIACSAPQALLAQPETGTTMPAPRQDTVLLVSLDGFRPDFLDLGITPHLQKLAADGVRAQWMNPSYPTLTFPNHYSIVTGLRPDHHGIVHNRMQDPVLGGFSLADRAAVGDSRWWGGEPIWIGVQKAGMRSATMFWPGSEAPVQGQHPTQWRPFDKQVNANQRVDQILAWLDQPAAERPRLLTLYFDNVDTAAHHDGPSSAQARAAIATVDAALGHLVSGLRKRGLLDTVDLIVVSDHGMAEVTPEHVLAIEDIVTPEVAELVSAGQVLTFRAKPGQTAQAERTLLGRHDHFECWHKERLPARWHYGSNPRVPPIVCQMDEGWDAIPRDTVAEREPGRVRGSHGYDPALPSMRALFIAHGPAFRQNVVIPAFDNVDMYPLLTHLLGIPAAANDGDIRPLLPALRAAAGTATPTR